MIGKNSVALLAAVSLIIVLLTIIFGVLLYGDFFGRDTYDGTFVAAEKDAVCTRSRPERNDSEWIYI